MAARSTTMTVRQSIVSRRARSLRCGPASRALEDRRRWEGTVAGLHEDGSGFTARVAMTPRATSAGMPIGFVVSSDALHGVRLAVDLHKTRTDTRSRRDRVPDALVIVNAADEIRPANVQEDILSGYSDPGAGALSLEADEILRGDSHQSAARSPVEMLIADRYLECHPGLRIGFFAELPTRSRQAEREWAIGNANGVCYVYKWLAFERCCQMVRTMGLLWP
jgi:hypothetical protein